ncbi:MAG: polysaccharide biosynthesis C-terminal domain-containing protein, partial [Chloroflexota bacterium]|nr:polysaccharide biosynthesis C-terminal domain-containing protein [Chloroflexota bacterium]
MGAGLVRGGQLLMLRLAQYTMLFGFNLAAARALDPIGRGAYILPFTLATTVWAVVHLSIEGSVGRLLARREMDMHRAARLLSGMVLLLGLLGVAAVHLVWQLAPALLPTAVSPTGVLIASLTIPFTLAAQMAAALLFRIGALLPYGWIVASAAALQLTLLLLLVVVASLTPELTLLVILVALIANAMALCYLVGRRLGMSALIPAADAPTLRRVLRMGAVLHPSSIALFLNMRLDLLIVGAIAGAGQAGLYSVSTSLAEIAFLVAWTVSLSALRTQTEASEEVAVAYTINLARQTLALAVCSAVALSLLAYPIVRVCFGAEWTASAVPLAILSVGAVALAVEGPVRGLLIRIAPLGHISAVAVAALALGIALDLILIPILGIIGAAIASLVSYWTAALLMLWLLRRETQAPLRSILALPRSTDAIALAVQRLR